MKQSFYQYVQTLRGALKVTPISQLAEDIFHDRQFPKQSESYHDISNYLETNAYYVTSMDVFDTIWEHYLESND